MASKDMMSTLTLIHNYWPEFSVSIKDLQSPTMEFLMSYFTNFLAELNEQVSIIAEDTVNEPVQELDSVHLYAKLSRILKKMNYTSFNFGDFCFPQSKRIYGIVKYSIHFLIFVNNSMENILIIYNQVPEKVTNLKVLNNLLQQGLKDIAENAENLGRYENGNDVLKKKLEATRVLHEKMRGDKVTQEKTQLEILTENNQLQAENDNLDYELKDLEGKEEHLQKHLVTEEDFKSLKNLENHLELEHEQITKESIEIDSDADRQTEMIQYAEEIAQHLEKADLDSLPLQDLRQLTIEVKPLKDINTQLKSDLSVQHDYKADRVNSINSKVRAEEETQNRLLELETKIASDSELYRAQYEREIVYHSSKFEHSQRFKTSIIEAEGDIQKAEDTEREVKSFAVKHYKRILDSSRASANKFNDVLVDLTQQI